MMNALFGACLAFSLAQAAWVRLASGSPEAWQQLGPRLLALLIVMLITTTVRKLVENPETRRVELTAYSSVIVATAALIVVVATASYQIVISGGDFGWCLIAILCVAAQGIAVAPILKARRRVEEI